MRSPLDTVRWLKPTSAFDDGLKLAAAWRSARRASGDRLALMAPAAEVARLQAALDAAGIAGVKVLDAAAYPDAVAVLKALPGGFTDDMLSGRKFRFLLRNDVRVDADFFNVSKALTAESSRTFQSALEVYMIVGEIMRAVPIAPNMLDTFETLRTVMIQA
jgi:hypothetical protein